MRCICSDLKSWLEEVLVKLERVGYIVILGFGEELFLCVLKCDSKNKYCEDVEDNNSVSFGSVLLFLVWFWGLLEDLCWNLVCGFLDEEFDSVLEKFIDYLFDWFISDLVLFLFRIFSFGEVFDLFDL